MELRPDAGVAIERAEADGDFVSLWPLAAKEARAADRAERLDATIGRPERPNQLLAGEEAKSLARDTALRAAEGTRVLAAAGAVTVIGP